MKKFETAGAEARAMDVDDFKTFLTEQYDRWGTLIRGANIHR